MSERARQWQLLRTTGLVDGPVPGEALRPAWFIRALQGFAAWVASLFLISFVASLLGFGDRPLGLLLTGVVLVVAAGWLTRLHRAHDFTDQLALAGSLAGQLLITLATFELAGQNVALTALVVIGVAGAIVMAIDQYLQRFIAGLAACMALGFLCFDASVAGLTLPLVGAATTALWLTEERWARRRGMLEPLAVAMAFAALGMALAFGGTALWAQMGLDDNLVPGWLEAGVMIALLLAVILKIQRALGADGAWRWQWLAVLLAAAATLAVALPGSGTALLVGVLALRSQRLTLAALSVMLLLGLFARHYYLLELTLMTKSLLLIGGGAVLLVLQQVLTRQADTGRRATLKARLSRPDTRQWLATLVVVAAMLFVLQDAWRSERTLDQGRVVLLELAPVDPRSLMQGDYMRLRFAIEQTVIAALGDTERRQGVLWVQVDEDGIGRFAGLDDGEPPAGKTVRIPYRYSPRGLELLTNAWFFQEGDAALYENARYGEFRVGNDGRVLLNAMRDEQLAVLGASRADR